MKSVSKPQYHLLALVTAAIWGTTFVSTKKLIFAGLDPSQIYAIRFVVAYIGIWIYSICVNKKNAIWSKSVKDELVFLLLGITGGSMYFLTENYALAATQACNVSFIVCSAPLITLLLNIAICKLTPSLARNQERVTLNLKIVIGTVLAISGMALVAFSDSKFNISPKGDFLALGAASCWAVYSIVMPYVSDRYSTVFITRKVFIYGLITVIPFLLSIGPVSTSMLVKPVVLYNLLFLSMVASLLCFLMWNKVMAEIGNVTSTNYVYLNPFFTLITASFFLGESLNAIEIIGSISIVLGVVLANKSAR